VVTGFSLRFSEAFWVDWLFGWGGGRGFLLRGWIHRVAAIVFTLGALAHVAYLFTTRGRGMLRDIRPRMRDVRDLLRNARHFAGRGDAPRFARFSYMEKAEYWALVWGTAIMSTSGVLLWFDSRFADLGLPRVALDVALVVHYYEAWLAFLAILVWHLYGTVFSPDVYPSNPAWFAGKMPAAMYEHEHADGPRLEVHAPKDEPAGGRPT
jgi:cytochrome b subunit of formate dehydrogenase